MRREIKVLSEIEKMMYDSQNKNIKIILNNSNIFEGYCTEFISHYDNDPLPSSLTVRIKRNCEINGIYFVKGQFVELYSHEIKNIIETNEV